MPVLVRRALVASLLSLAVVGCGSSTTTSAPPSTAAATAGMASPSADTATAPTASPPEFATRFRTLLGSEYNGAALVARDGVILASEGVGLADAATDLPNRPETRFRIGSVSKQFTAMAILLLIGDGLVSLSDHACDVLVACPSGWEAITVEHLLGHTSGIAEFTEQPGFDPTRAATPAETVASVADIPLAFDPGRFFAYSNTGYVILGMIIERASGSTYEAFLRDRIFGPLGMADTGYDSGDDGVAAGYTTAFEPAGHIDMSIPFSAGALYSTVLDLQRWDEALYTDALIPAAARDQFFAPLIDISDRVGMGYGFGLQVGTEDGRRLVAHDGGIDGFHAYLARYPDDHVVVALLTNREAGPDLWSLASAAAAMAREAAVTTTSAPPSSQASVEWTAPMMTVGSDPPVRVAGEPTGYRIELSSGKHLPVTYRARLAVGGAPCDGSVDPAVGPDAAAILAALQARPGWTVTTPTPLTLGSATGWWVDIRRPDDLTCPDGGINVPLVVSDLDPASSYPAVHIDPNYASRLVILDDGRGATIVIDINAHRGWGQAALVESAMPIIEKIRFGP